MHDIDRTQLESEYAEGEVFEFGHEGESFGEYGEGPFSEAEEMEMAAELLGITTEAELDQFLGGLIKKAGRAVGGFVRSPVGRALGSGLKGLAKQALPMAGRAIGTYFGGPIGAQLGGQLGTMAGRWLGNEAEGLSHEDQEFEVARRFVRLAGTAASQAATAPQGSPPAAAAQQAIAAAAQQHAPALLRHVAGNASTAATGARKRSGRWVRRGRVILVLGV